jgi:hypothetical protein
MKTNYSYLPPDAFATFVGCDIVDGGSALAVLVQERDGSVSAVKIAVEQVAD